jgi:hypothetical protein
MVSLFLLSLLSIKSYRKQAHIHLTTLSHPRILWSHRSNRLIKPMKNLRRQCAIKIPAPKRESPSILNIFVRYDPAQFISTTVRHYSSTSSGHFLNLLWVRQLERSTKPLLLLMLLLLLCVILLMPSLIDPPQFGTYFFLSVYYGLASVNIWATQSAYQLDQLTKACTQVHWMQCSG